MRSTYLRTLVVVGLVCGLAHAIDAQTPTGGKRSPTSGAAATQHLKGCLQGSSERGFTFQTPTGPANSGHAQMRTYQVVAGPTLDLSPHANKMVEITGTLTPVTGTAKAPVPGSVRNTGGAGGRAEVIGVDGRLTASAVQDVAGSCSNDASK